jgi:hypothetical protein
MVDAEKTEPIVDAEQVIQEWETLYEVHLTCPSGVRVVVTPPTLLTFVRAGRVPQELAKLFNAQDAERVLSEMPEETAADSLLYSQRMCEGVLLKPRAVAPNPDGTIRPLKKGEIDARRIPNADLFFIAGWAANYSAADELSKARTEVTRADALNFRDNAGLSAGGVDGEGIQPAPVESAGDQQLSVSS